MEGQVKMQSRLEEEEEAKAALMSRIQRLTKLILVSSKNTVPGCLSDVPGHQRGNSFRDDIVSTRAGNVTQCFDSLSCVVKQSPHHSTWGN